MKLAIAFAALAALAALASCVTPLDDAPDGDPSGDPAATKVYDLSPRRLDELAADTSHSESAKAQILATLATARPGLARCLRGANHPAGTVDVSLTIAVEPDDAPAISDVRIEAFGDPMLASCLRAAIRGADTSLLVAPASAERWVIDAPLVVDAAYPARI